MSTHTVFDVVRRNPGRTIEELHAMGYLPVGYAILWLFVAGLVFTPDEDAEEPLIFRRWYPNT